MKKLAVIFAMAFGLGLLGTTAASADPLNCSDFGCTGVNDAGYIVVADGAPGNPDPSDGYIGVTDDGQLACSDTGGPYSADDADHTPQACNPGA